MIYDDAVLYTFDEFQRVVEGDKSLSITEVRDRQDGCMAVFFPTEFKIFISDEAREFLHIIKSKITENGEIKGIVASRGVGGVISGEVSVVLDPTRDSFESEKILVTSMTRTEFVPLMKRAKAIITDEGGIACHASVISRELGIPCVIGTKNGTHILKNGDHIQVNLQTGEIEKV